MTRLRSFQANNRAAKNAVNVPKPLMRGSTEGACSKSGEQRRIMNTPAVNTRALCEYADTGATYSIRQPWRLRCVDFITQQQYTDNAYCVVVIAGERTVFAPKGSLKERKERQSSTFCKAKTLTVKEKSAH
jgi:hypothetical protein